MTAKVVTGVTGNRAVANEADLRSDPSTHTVTVEHADKTFVLTLRRTGKRGGSLKVNETTSGKAPHDDALPDTVEDHYRYYQGESNYKLWMTDPRYRVTIEPTDEDRALLK